MQRRGTVAGFASDGWGIVTDDGGASYPFHSTAVADGTRSIEPGVSVSFALVPGRQGRWEATDLRPTVG